MVAMNVQLSTSSQPLVSETEVMRAVEFQAPERLVLNNARPRPQVTDPGDAVVRITCTTICGSDLHLYNKAVPGVSKGDIFGHEGVGIVDAIGPQVKRLKVGDRVVLSAVIADGVCGYCKEGRTSLCDTTNPSEDMRKMYGGYATAGLFGYSALTGAYPGTLAEYVRVPHADFNCLVIPGLEEGSSPSPGAGSSAVLSDEQAMLLSDVCCTAWHATELAELQAGDNVAVWGAGPVGLLTAYFAAYKGAMKIVVIDCVPERLSLARHKIKNCDTLNFKESEDVVKDLHGKFVASGGPNKAIDCVGFRFPKTWKHSLETLLSLENDALDVVNEAILSVRKGGTVVLVGDYFSYGNHMAIGPLMEKSIRLVGGQVFVHKYWQHLYDLMVAGKIHPEFIFTHRLPLESTPEAYAMFDKKKEGMIKVIIKPTQRHQQ